MDADLGDDEEMEKCKGEEEYEYPYSDSDEAPEVSPGQVCSFASMLSFPPPLLVSVGTRGFQVFRNSFRQRWVVPSPSSCFLERVQLGAY